MICADRLTVRYPHRASEAVREVCLALREGETVLLSGMTGSGKSTLLMAIVGVIPHLVRAHLGGTVHIEGVSPWRIPLWKTSQTVGVLLQHAEAMMFTETVEDEILFGLENACLPPNSMRERVQQVMELTGISHLAGRSLRTLSSGELQRVAIASLLALDQPYLLLDEPLAFLDHEGRHALLSLLNRLVWCGKGLLIVEHRNSYFHNTDITRLFLHHGSLEVSPRERRSLPRCYGIGGGRPVLTFEEVTFAWDGSATPLFSSASFEVSSGESVVLQGANGVGKTTILLLAMGLLRPLRGKIITAGVEVTAHTSSRIGRRAALVLQSPHHQLFMPTVWEEVRVRAKDDRNAREELELLQLSHLAQCHPRSLSLGQMRRLTVAAALAAAPSLLLLDEPSVGQDDVSLRLMLERLRRFLQEGGTLLTTTHDERVARALGERTLTLRDGTVYGERRKEDDGKVEKGCGVRSGGVDAARGYACLGNRERGGE